ncbi:MAG: FecR domain-containing protein [Chitinophagaceae bacterium]|nr:FecR domain-containing protein [Chitinophagaceae bacterium]
MEQKARLNYLLTQLSGQYANDAELVELMDWVSQDDTDKTIGYIEEQLAVASPLKTQPFDKDKWMQVADKILRADKTTATPVIKPGIFSITGLKRHWVAAAAIISFFTLLTIWLIPARKPGAALAAETNKPVPGKEGAILTLSDGSSIVLDSAGNGLIAQQQGTQVLLDSGRLSYEGGQNNSAVLNTLSTPRGRQFHIQLPDGTHVWLNSASSLTYPTVFTGKERVVSMTGEAYFEVAKNRAMPFRVLVDEQAEVKVLGTSFNLNAYGDNGHIDATLLQGVVEVGVPQGNERRRPIAVQLRPGQMAQVSKQVQVNDDPDIDKIMAWKNGLFNFEGSSLVEVMKQLERWYDIQVVYPSTIPAITFFGELNRSTPLEGAVRALERSGVHFRMEGRKLIVMSKPIQ